MRAKKYWRRGGWLEEEGTGWQRVGEEEKNTVVEMVVEGKEVRKRRERSWDRAVSVILSYFCTFVHIHYLSQLDYNC